MLISNVIDRGVMTWREMMDKMSEHIQLYCFGLTEEQDAQSRAILEEYKKFRKKRKG